MNEDERNGGPVKNAKIDREKLFQIFCVYALALAASVVCGESFAKAKRLAPAPTAQAEASAIGAKSISDL